MSSVLLEVCEDIADVELVDRSPFFRLKRLEGNLFTFKCPFEGDVIDNLMLRWN